MKKLVYSFILLVMAVGCQKSPNHKISASPAASPSMTEPVSGPFTAQELRQFTALDPIDTHTHVYMATPQFYAMLKNLNLHILDITLKANTLPQYTDLAKEKAAAWKVVDGSDGYVAFCSTFDPYQMNRPDFAQLAIRGINEDFAKGAVAVKIWKNVGMEIRDNKGNYIMPDNAILEPIFQDIEKHKKTLIAHLADPNSVWEAPNTAAPDYEYLKQNPALYMYGKPAAPSKAEILRARDHILENNPKLRVVGAHLGSMESDFNQLGRHLDKYPNLAVDLAARVVYFEMQPRENAIAFITKYQDRLIYGTDNEFDSVSSQTLSQWQETYANDWRYFATNDIILYRNQKIRGLALPPSILQKIYHSNAVKWFPGIVGVNHMLDSDSRKK